MDVVGIVFWCIWCDMVGVVMQEFVLNNSVFCGLMIGLIIVIRFGICMVDVGILILFMYFVWEFVGVFDLYDFVCVVEVFFVG